MSAETPAVVRSFPVGKFRCTVALQRPATGDVVLATCRWEPYRPKRLRPDEIAQYRAGRDAAVTELARLTGLPAAVVEA